MEGFSESDADPPELDVQLCQLGQSNFLWSLTKSAQPRLAAATD